MKQLAAVLATGLLLAAYTSIKPAAQTAAARIAFIDSQAVIASHPAGAVALNIQRQGQQELAQLRSRIEELAALARAGDTLSPEQQERYQVLVTTYQTRASVIEQEFQSAVQPAVEAVDSAIAVVAEANGYTVVLDAVASGKPQGTGLVVYAQRGMDITEQVIAELK